MNPHLAVKARGPRMITEQLITGCKKQELKSQKALYDLLHPQMFGVCLRYAKNRDEAQDVLQEGFVKMFQKIDSYRGDGSFAGWVKRIMVNTALEHYRKKKAEGIEVPIEHESLMVVSENNVMNDMRAQDILRVVQKLPAGYRLVFNLFAIEGYSHKEIAAQLGVSENTSYSQYHRARALLRKLLETEEQTGTKTAVG